MIQNKKHKSKQFKRRRIDPFSKIPQDLGPRAAVLYMALSYPTNWRHTLPSTWAFLYKIGISGLGLDYFSSGSNEIKNEESEDRNLHSNFGQRCLAIVNDIALGGTTQFPQTEKPREFGKRLANSIEKFHEWMFLLLHPNEEPHKMLNLIVHVAGYNHLHDDSLQSWVSQDLSVQLKKVSTSLSTFSSSGTRYIIAIYEVGSTLVVTLGVIHRKNGQVNGPLRVINAFLVSSNPQDQKKQEFPMVRVKLEDEEYKEKIKLEPPGDDDKWVCPAWAAAIKIGLVISAAARDG